jgi:3'-5' exoribonuclease
MENKGLYINDLPQSGEVTFLAVVIEKELRPKRNGGSFLSLRLADRSGELDAKAWENPEAVAQLFDCNDVVKVRGAIDHYNDKPQLIVSRIRRCEGNEYVAADFYPASNRDPEEMFGELEIFVAMVRDELLRQLLESIVADASTKQRLKAVPAAMKIHHAFRGGLLEHVLSLCNLAVALTAHYPRLNLDWLIAGAILHDLGKIETLELTGVRFAYTTRGQLIEHVTLGLEILEKHVGRFPGFPLELKTVLQHFIVSHHGDLDKGALRRPMLPEAFALSMLDLMDARLDQVFRLIDSAPAEEAFTSYVPSLERQLFRGFEPADPGRRPQTIEKGQAA